MTQPLLSISQLLDESWEKTKRHWSSNLQISLGFLGLAVLSFVINLTAYQLFQTIPPMLRLIDAFVIQGLGSLWVTMRLTQAVLIQDQEKKKIQETNGGMKTYLSFLWVGILSGLAVLGGGLVFVLPGIWLLVLLSFSTYLFLEDGIRGTKALASSAELVRGRWWATLFRLLVPGLLVTVIVIIFLSMIQGSVHLLAGYRLADVIDNAGGSYWWINMSKQAYMAYVANQSIDAIAATLFSPVYLALSIRLFHDLKKSK